jgi:phage-related protein
MSKGPCPYVRPVVYRVDVDAIVIGEVFQKKTGKTPQGVIERCRRRLRAYDRAARAKEKG